MEQEKSPLGDLSGVLGNILSDPAQMAKLTQLAGALASSGGLGALLGGGASMAGERADVGAASEESIASMEEVAAPQTPEVLTPPRSADGAADMMAALAKLSGGMGRVQTTKHEALLKALRPYLSSERQTRIDGLLRLLTLVNVLGGVLGTTQSSHAMPPRTP